MAKVSHVAMPNLKGLGKFHLPGSFDGKSQQSWEAALVSATDRIWGLKMALFVKKWLFSWASKNSGSVTYFFFLIVIFCHYLEERTLDQ